jgi:RHS repeat-associated protein
MPRLRGHTHEKSGLYYLGDRYYYPEIGRWTQRDPVGMVNVLNLYLHPGSEPLNRIDAWGLSVWELHFGQGRPAGVPH